MPSPWDFNGRSKGLAAGRRHGAGRSAEMQRTRVKRGDSVLRLEQLCRKFPQVLAPQRPHVAEPGNFPVREPDIFRLHPRRELAVDAQQSVVGDAGHPQEFQSRGALGRQLRKVLFEIPSFQSRPPRPGAPRGAAAGGTGDCELALGHMTNAPLIEPTYAN